MSELKSDVFGKAIMAYANGMHDAEMEVWINGELDDPIGISTFFRTFEQMPDLEKLALNLAKGNVLDVGAAAGCHSRILQERGFQVSALERSALCCEYMKSSGIAQVYCSDVMNFQIEKKFNTIFLLMNGIGMGARMSEMGKFLAKLDELLAPGGKVIADSSDLIYLYQEEDGSISLPLHRYYGELEFEVRFDGNVEQFSWIYIDPDTMKDLCDAFGWQMEILAEGEHYDYLFELSRNP